MMIRRNATLWTALTAMLSVPSVANLIVLVIGLDSSLERDLKVRLWAPVPLANVGGFFGPVLVLLALGTLGLRWRSMNLPQRVLLSLLVVAAAGGVYMFWRVLLFPFGQPLFQR